MNTHLFLHVGIMYAILIGLNLPAPFLGLNFGDEAPRLSYQPPGFVIPIVWFVLFTLLGIARYILVEQGTGVYNRLLIGLAVLCAAYAYYTLGLSKLTGISALWFGLWGNLLVILFALYVASRIWSVSATAFWLVIPVALWTAFATCLVLGEMKLNKLV